MRCADSASDRMVRRGRHALSFRLLTGTISLFLSLGTLRIRVHLFRLVACSPVRSPRLQAPAGKPTLRGVSHLIATIPAIIAALLLAQHATGERLQLGVVLYGTTMILLFAVSGFYHTPNPTPSYG